MMRWISPWTRSRKPNTRCSMRYMREPTQRPSKSERGNPFVRGRHHRPAPHLESRDRTRGVVMTNMILGLTESAGRHPDAAVLECGDATTTYSMLAADVARFADYLIDGGVKPDDRVGVML